MFLPPLPDVRDSLHFTLIVWTPCTRLHFQMDKGKCVELASPAELLDIKGGHFAAMVDALGKEGAQLRRMAITAAAVSAAKKKTN